MALTNVERETPWGRAGSVRGTCDADTFRPCHISVFARLALSSRRVGMPECVLGRVGVSGRDWEAGTDWEEEEGEEDIFQAHNVQERQEKNMNEVKVRNSDT